MRCLNPLCYGIDPENNYANLAALRSITFGSVGKHPPWKFSASVERGEQDKGLL
jgi:hypothetical protein